MLKHIEVSVLKALQLIFCYLDNRFIRLYEEPGNCTADAGYSSCCQSSLPAIVSCKPGGNGRCQYAADIAPEVHPAGYRTGKFAAHGDYAGPGSTHSQTKRA